MSKADDIIIKLKSNFKDCIESIEHPLKSRLFIKIKKEEIKNISNELINMGARYLVSVGYDDIKREGALGLVHTFSFDRDDLFACLRSYAPADNPVFDSISNDIPNAEWSEREYIDLLGMKFNNHPKPKKLVLSDDWPEGIYPLRKEVPWNIAPPSAEDTAYMLDECPENCSILPVGPFHPTLHEPAHFALYVDGETIKGCDYRGFMAHRGIEKLCESQVTYNEVPFIAERICGICGSVHATSYAQAVEMAGEIKISRKAEFIRVIMLELERIHSHLLWLGVAGHLIGFDTVFMQAWRVREQLMWLCERITGNRKTYGMIVIGGVRRDITPEHRDDILKVINKIEKELNEIHRSISGDSAIHKRTKRVGLISKETTVKWSLVGPTARARGVDIDSRRDHPYAAYNEIDFEVPVLPDCDVWATVVVRILETFEAIKIIRQALKKMPASGNILTEVTAEITPFRHAITAVEAPRGEVVHYLITGEENRPERWRVRAPTYPNLQGIPSMILDENIADVPIIIGSIDPCFSCTDRVMVIDRSSGKTSIISGNELEKISRKFKK